MFEGLYNVIMIAIIIYIAHVVLFFFLGRLYGKDIIKGLKGENNEWDAPELIVALWVLVFIIVMLANLFLDFEVSSHLWYSMDLILISALGGRGLLEYINKKK